MQKRHTVLKLRRVCVCLCLPLSTQTTCGDDAPGNASARLKELAARHAFAHSGRRALRPDAFMFLLMFALPLCARHGPCMHVVWLCQLPCDYPSIDISVSACRQVLGTCDTCPDHIVPISCITHRSICRRRSTRNERRKKRRRVAVQGADGAEDMEVMLCARVSACKFFSAMLDKLGDVVLWSSRQVPSLLFGRSAA